MSAACPTTLWPSEQTQFNSPSINGPVSHLGPDVKLDQAFGSRFTSQLSDSPDLGHTKNPDLTSSAHSGQTGKLSLSCYTHPHSTLLYCFNPLISGFNFQILNTHFNHTLKGNVFIIFTLPSVFMTDFLMFYRAAPMVAVVKMQLITISM